MTICKANNVLGVIKNKLIDEAKNIHLSRPDIVSWHDLKNLLRQKFGDPITPLYYNNYSILELVVMKPSYNF